MKSGLIWSAVILLLSVFLAGCTPRDADRTQENPPTTNTSTPQGTRK